MEMLSFFGPFDIIVFVHFQQKKKFTFLTLLSLKRIFGMLTLANFFVEKKT